MNEFFINKGNGISTILFYIRGERERQTHRETETERDRQRQRETDRDRAPFFTSFRINTLPLTSI